MKKRSLSFFPTLIAMKPRFNIGIGNITLKYRSNLNKQAGSDPISALLSERKI